MISLSDLPLEHTIDDSLGRDVLAIDLATYILNVNPKFSYTIAISGSWGSGKTSLFNLTRIHLNRNPNCLIIEFNPWFFSDAENLTELLLGTLAKKLRLKDPKTKKVAKLISKYGKELGRLGSIPHVGPFFAFLGWASRLFGKESKISDLYSFQKSNIKTALLALQIPIVIFIDDIDRLDFKEILDIFKMVRLTANFPNVIFVLAFDRQHVIEILNSGSVDGAPYLEKIIGVTIDIPKPSDKILTEDLEKLLNRELFPLVPSGHFSQTAWPDIFFEIIRPLIGNHRDAKRYVATLTLTLRSLNERIDLTDLLALEAIRLFRPELFLSLQMGQNALVDTSQLGVSGAADKATIDGIFSKHSSESQLIRSLISRLFPAASKHIGNASYGGEWRSTWLKDSRVAHPEVLRFYFERFESEEFKAFSLAKTILEFTTFTEMSNFLNGLDIEALGKCIQALENFEQDYPNTSVIPLSKALLNSLPRLLTLPHEGFLQITPRLIVSRVVLRLLRSLQPGSIDIPVLEILSGLDSLSSKMSLIELVGHRQNVGHGLISETLAQQLEINLLSEIRRADSSKLIGESDLIGLLMTKSWWEPQGPKILPDYMESELIQSILSASISYGVEQSFDSRATRRIAHLQWDALLEIFGNSQAIQNAIYQIEHLPNNSVEVIEAINQVKGKLAENGSEQISGKSSIEKED